MTPIADDISDALKALREEIPPWRKPLAATVCETCNGEGRIDERLGGIATSGWVDCPDCKPRCAKCGGLRYIWAASYITGRIDCPDCVKPTGSAP